MPIHRFAANCRRFFVKFWLLWGFDALIALVALYFFFAGLADGSVSSFNMGLWLVILLVLGGVVMGSLWLRSSGRSGTAKAVLLILAVPGLLFVLYFLVLLISAPRWN
jgi:hypothetical protein